MALHFRADAHSARRTQGSSTAKSSSGISCRCQCHKSRLVSGTTGLHCVLCRGGNSGSPVWVVWQQQKQQQQALNGTAAEPGPPWEQFQAVGVHSSSLKFPRDSQVGEYAEALYAQSIASEQQRQAAAAAAGRRAPSCTAATSSFSQVPFPDAAASASSAGSSPAARASQPLGAAAPTGSASRAAAAAGAIPTGRRRALLAGAGGREPDGEHTLLPVAVPFTGDTYKWLEGVLKEFESCPGE